MGRIIAIDYGQRRTGLAVTDPSQLIATGLATVETSVLLSWLEQYMAGEHVEAIVLGEPRQADGTPSENMQRVKAFARQWQRKHPDIPIHFYDERFTSVLAHKAMLDGGLRQKARRNKALVDRISATILLEDYLNSRQRHETTT
ncbi:MAG: Holliday junction resolvase RuvX [Bacteroidaceae bacterium]|nr:Holliday junction resolvase RuvX [Bacteroidaceae bacterium]